MFGGVGREGFEEGLSTSQSQGQKDRWEGF